MEYSNLLSSLNSFLAPQSFANWLPSLSSISFEHGIFLILGLMFFRLFAGLIFSLLGLVSTVFSSLASVFCVSISAIIRLATVFTTSVLQLTSNLLSQIISQPMRIVSMTLSRWGHLFIPVLASGIISTLCFKPLDFWISKFTTSPWVEIEASQSISELEAF